MPAVNNTKDNDGSQTHVHTTSTGGIVILVLFLLVVLAVVIVGPIMQARRWKHQADTIAEVGKTHPKAATALAGLSALSALNNM